MKTFQNKKLIVVYCKHLPLVTFVHYNGSFVSIFDVKIINSNVKLMNMLLFASFRGFFFSNKERSNCRIISYGIFFLSLCFHYDSTTQLSPPMSLQHCLVFPCTCLKTHLQIKTTFLVYKATQD